MILWLFRVSDLPTAPASPRQHCYGSGRVSTSDVRRGSHEQRASCQSEIDAWQRVQVPQVSESGLDSPGKARAFKATPKFSPRIPASRNFHKNSGSSSTCCQSGLIVARFFPGNQTCDYSGSTVAILVSLFQGKAEVPKGINPLQSGTLPLVNLGSDYT